ncbi:ead/Ea22-like family protein [Klebsiella pneumoniae]|uniref:ead/Ea22-like family protein n=1 Tax=Klebsiella pneumoniae TaxID=573 RepID=UPI00196553DA|nr:ead/Ea22-like family protein [Klebsiella pneumoniae]
MKLFEMEGFLRGKCIPRDLKVNETNAEYLVRKFAEADAMCAALAAENAGLIEQAEEVYAAGYNHGHLNTVDGIAYADCVKDDFYGLAVELMREAETTATEAFLDEVRAQGVKSLSNAVQSVIAERQRQQSAEGWTSKHDDKHDNNELAFAASCYAFHSAAASWDFEDDGTPYDIHPAPKNWPWAPEWWKPTNPRPDLVKAGALILAEIERIDRQEAAQ